MSNENKRLNAALEGTRLDRRSLMRKTAAAGASLTAAGGLAHYSGHNASAQSTTTALQIGRETEFSPIFVPFFTSTGTQAQINDLIYSRLLKVRDDVQFEPDAAESFEISDDARVFTFKIREGMTWHDG